MCYLGVLFFTNVFRCSKYCPTFLESVGQRVSNKYFREFSLFNVDFIRGNYTSARRASAANAVDIDTDISTGCSVSVNMISQ